MTTQRPILILAGTYEGRAVADALHARNFPAIASLAGATRDAARMPVPTRVGGFGGEAGFRAFLTENNVRAVLDATHPFAHRISRRSYDICADQGVPYLQVLRPGWAPVDGDNWHFIDSEDQAAALIPSKATVFLATGRQTLDRFQNLTGRRVVCRQIDPPTCPFPFEGGEYLIGRPPFSVEDETQLFRELGVDWLVVKNAGGHASATKLTAARHLKIPVIMINRPPSLDAPCVTTVEEALAWPGLCD